MHFFSYQPPKLKITFQFFSFVLLCLHFFICQTKSQAQDVSKDIDVNSQFWISTNNVFQITDKWAILNDIHIRRTEFVKNPSFYFLRFGAQYRLGNGHQVAGGYAHLWLERSGGNWDQFLNENRIYQQYSIAHAFPNTNILFRVRNEQRFFNNVVDRESLGDNFMVNRFRLLLSLGIPLSPESRTQIILADEIHLNFGENVVYNTFNQNRLTIGIKHKLSETWSFDLGYMLVYQQFPSGVDYDLNHTLRLFFYGRFDLRKDDSKKLEYIQHGEE
ncbi:MAG: DUF2490 domain-containing protein [Flavobacteriales bacterium]|nr:DUF2490 domain-containing protein [Flavobacteriales bacterium]